jgi:ubiquinone/menaquinone biosynthesis C-methylase UbiE
MVKDTAQGNDRNIELLGRTDGMTVLDIGFGQGSGVQKLAEQGATVYGCDVSHTMLRQATRRNRRHIAQGVVDLRVSDGVTIPFETDSVDAVVTAHTIYFWRQPSQTLAEISRVLRPGGSFSLAFVCSDEGVADWKDPNIYTMYTMFEVIKMLEVAGFVDVECAGADDAPSNMRWARSKNPTT